MNVREEIKMKRRIAILVHALLLIVMTGIVNVFADEEERKIEILSENKVDVTGNGQEDTVLIKGERFEEGANYFKNLYVVIDASNGKKYKIDLEGGYDPTIEFADLNGDGVKDLFITVPTGGSGGLSNYYLYTLKDFVLTDITVPSPLVIQSQFLDGYKAKITIEETKKTYKFNLKDRAKDYERLGLYNNGKLNEPTELMVDPFGLLTVTPVKGNKLGLKGVQRISGAYHADGIADVESTWFYQKGQWKLLDTKVKKLSSIETNQ